MATKSDKFKQQRISATNASRSFSSLLDRVARGDRFVVQRHGRDVCVIAPAPVEGRTVGECLAMLQGRAFVLLDDRFARDLMDVITEERAEEPIAWDS
jgi:antitoxin (DNA-binding transcriptional repressor) of toxin-antitoxin stability system